MIRTPPLLLVLLLATSCAHGQRPPPTSSLSAPRGEPSGRGLRFDDVRIRAGEDRLTGLDAYDAVDLFDLGFAAIEAEQFGRARLLYTRLLEEFPDHLQALPAHHNLALACEKDLHWQCAAREYAAYADAIEERSPQSAVTTRLRLATIQQAQGWYQASEQVIEQILASPDLDEMDRWEARVLGAMAATDRGAYRYAESELNQTRISIRRATRRDGVPNTYHSAMVWYHAAELFRIRAERTLLVQTTDLELTDKLLREKASFVREAFHHYKKTLRHKIPEWSGPAALKMGQLYEVLRADMLLAPLPEDLDVEARAVYRELLEERTLPLIEGAALVYRWVIDEQISLRMDEQAIKEIHSALRRCEEELRSRAQAAASF